MFSTFFIDRPIFASVLSILITLGGAIALLGLPIAQYPEITPPTVEVTAIYPGAEANVLNATVAAPIEQQVNGVEGMLYMSSQCTSDGTYTLTVTFGLGVDLNIAQVLVQNRVALAQPILPDLVTRKGVTVKKKSPNILMIVNLYSPDSSQDPLELSNHATIHIRDELARLPGVGDITYLGQRDYSMRVWLDPQKMAARNLTASDVISALQQQNTQVAAGQIGQPPVPSGQAFQYTMTTLGRLADVNQFGDIILKTDSAGRLVRVQDVARIERGALAYDQSCMLDGKPSVALSVYQLPGTNALQTAKAVKEKMKELSANLKPGMKYDIVYDTTPFINESINEVYGTLIDAVILVAVVVLLFLQHWRTAIIPLVAVPVAIVGTFAVMAIMGFSLNNLTLFGLVLAIGIVVDDAIVVVEAVERNLEHGLSSRDAAIKAMQQVSGPVIAVGLVLSAVFVPCAFISGITGQFFRQFALTIAVSTVISAFCSLTLSPALSAILIQSSKHGSQAVLPPLGPSLFGAWLGFRYLSPSIVVLAEKADPKLLDKLTADHAWLVPLAVTLLCGIVGFVLDRAVNNILGWAFRWFNIGFEWATEVYAQGVRRMLRMSLLVLLGYGGLLVLTYYTFQYAPSGFIPLQDKGYLLVNVQLPDAASLERTQAIMAQSEKIARSIKGVKHTVVVAGQSLLLNANSSNYGAMYVMLDEFHERAEKGLSGDKIATELQDRLKNEIGDGAVSVFNAPAVDGLGTAGGFKIIIEDRTGTDQAGLQAVGQKIVEDGNDQRALQSLFSSFRADTPWLFLDINRKEAKMLGLSMTEIFNTLQVYMASYYVNDFNLFGRTWQVNLQAEPSYRKQYDTMLQFKIRNTTGTMVPLGTVASVHEISGPSMIQRYNMYLCTSVNATPAPGVSSGKAIELMENDAKKEIESKHSLRYAWTELAFLQLQTGNTAMIVFLIAVVLVFLVLAAQYESWSLPLAVIMVVPMCLLCSVVGVILAHLDVNIFTQIGFVVLVGLACENAILIVEYARQQTLEGHPADQATLEACRLRLRPIVMTSLAFILGVVPLVVAEGAGEQMRRTLGTAVFAGMLGVTIFGIFLTPVFYYVIQLIVERTTPALPVDAPYQKPPDCSDAIEGLLNGNT